MPTELERLREKVRLTNEGAKKIYDENERLRERIERAVEHLDGLGTLTDTERAVLAILEGHRYE